MKDKVFVGLSGGVDSAVSAALLIDQGYDVTGVFMKNWSGLDYGVDDDCPWEVDQNDSMEVCEQLKIPCKVYNFEREYREFVVEDFFKEYEAGRTPNPDVLCNKYIKFDKFLEKALNDGADYIATGHYSKVSDGKLFKAADQQKDQTYFLNQLTSDQLKKTLFPLAEYTKDRVREIALDKNLPVAKKKDSQGICFIGKIDVKEFLSSRLTDNEGSIVDIDTKQVVGKHSGLWKYTLGQRRGIQIGGTPKPYFVAKKDIESNILYVAMGKKNNALWKTRLRISKMHFIRDADLSHPKTASIRYRSEDSQVRVSNSEDSFFVEFLEPQWAPSEGQSLVLFEGEECIGGGVIDYVF